MASLLYNFFPTDLLTSEDNNNRRQILLHEARTMEGKPKAEQLPARVRDNLQFNFFPADLLPSVQFSNDGAMIQARSLKNRQTQDGSVQANPELSILHISSVLPNSGEASTTS
uniref:Uncharacterized protein n=1 Tax=Nelumbo nucifera TaxID=4432 RepID=A0A822YBL0_NELNU|nr:TPA_asm: hypothetical protein HUJ06_030971 [Nelumbo nucifera]